MLQVLRTGDSLHAIRNASSFHIYPISGVNYAIEVFYIALAEQEH